MEELQSGGRTFGSGQSLYKIIAFYPIIIPFSYPGGDELTHSSEDEVNDTSLLSPQQDAAIRLPASLFESIQYHNSIGIFFAFYEQSTLFPVNTDDDDSGAPSKVQVGSPVIASTVGGDNFSIENLGEPVIITLKIVRVSVRCCYQTLQCAIRYLSSTNCTIGFCNIWYRSVC